MAESSSKTSNQFRLPPPTAVEEEVANLNPPSLEKIESNIRDIITHYDDLEARSDRGLEKLVRLAESTTTAVAARTLSDRERMRSWHLLETEVKRAKEQVTKVHAENSVWMACSRVFQRYMWEYSRSLDRAVLSMDTLEAEWAQERRFLIALCRNYIPADAAERLDLNKVMQDETQGGDGEEEDVSLAYLANMYTVRIGELKREVANLEKDNSALKGKRIMDGEEIPSAVAEGEEPVRDDGGAGPSTAREGAPEPGMVLHGDLPRNHYDDEAFTHVLRQYRHTRDLMHQLFTAQTINKVEYEEQFLILWESFHKQFEALRLLGTQLPASLTTQVAELDLEMGEPEHLPGLKTKPHWLPVQARIDGEVAGKSKEDLEKLVRECKAANAPVIRELAQV